MKLNHAYHTLELRGGKNALNSKKSSYMCLLLQAHVSLALMAVPLIGDSKLD